MPHHNFTGEGTLTYPTLTPKHHGTGVGVPGYSITMASSPMATTPMAVASPAATSIGPGYDEIPVHEPNLNKKPLRSALKGAKKQESLQRQLQLQLQQKQQEMCRSSSLGETPRAPPKVAPKPKTVRVGNNRYIFNNDNNHHTI